MNEPAPKNSRWLQIFYGALVLLLLVGVVISGILKSRVESRGRELAQQLQPLEEKASDHQELRDYCKKHTPQDLNRDRRALAKELSEKLEPFMSPEFRNDLPNKLFDNSSLVIAKSFLDEIWLYVGEEKHRLHVDVVQQPSPGETVFADSFALRQSSWNRLVFKTEFKNQRLNVEFNGQSVESLQVASTPQKIIWEQVMPKFFSLKEKFDTKKEQFTYTFSSIETEQESCKIHVRIGMD